VGARRLKKEEGKGRKEKKAVSYVKKKERKWERSKKSKGRGKKTR